MSIVLRRVSPLQLRDQIVEFFWQIRMWPYPTKQQYFDLWDWRYSSLSEGDPATWVALDGSVVVGHITVYFRNLCVDGRQIRSGVCANFRVDRNAPLGAALMSAPRNLVRRGEIDLLTGYGNKAAHQLTTTLGSRSLGPMRTLVRVRDWASVLRRRYVFLKPLAPFFNVAARTRRLISRATLPTVRTYLKARILSAEEIESLTLSHWQLDVGPTWHGDLRYWARRFCNAEFSSSYVFGITDVRSKKVEALVAVSGSNQLTILQCETNRSFISPIEAIETIFQSNPAFESVRVPLLPQTNLANGFLAAGYIQLPLSLSGSVIANTVWSAYWLPEHPLATSFEQTQNWNLWSGWNHY